MPKVTVLMPVYNGEKFLREAIDSVLNQTREDFEFLIIDDESADKTPDIVSSYKDTRIHFVRNDKNLGQMETLNKGVRLSRGRYIARMDQDDISLPRRFEREAEILEKHSDIAMVYADSFIIDEKGKRGNMTLFDFTRPERACVFNKLLKRNFIVGNTVMVRKKVFDETGLYNPQYRVVAEYDFFVRLAQRHKVDFVNEPLAEYRVHEKNTSSDPEICIKETIEVLNNLSEKSHDKDTKKAFNKAISWHISGLSMNYLFQDNRILCRKKARSALKLNPCNPKALAALFMSIFFPFSAIKSLSVFRKGFLKQ